MTAEQIPLIQKDISMLTEKLDKIANRVDDEARKAQAHREESLKFHADLLEKLDKRFAGKWTERVLTFIGTGIGIAIIGAIMALILKQ